VITGEGGGGSGGGGGGEGGTLGKIEKSKGRLQGLLKGMFDNIDEGQEPNGNGREANQEKYY